MRELRWFQQAGDTVGDESYERFGEGEGKVVEGCEVLSGTVGGVEKAGRVCGDECLASRGVVGTMYEGSPTW